MGLEWASWLINSECDYCFWEHSSRDKKKDHLNGQIQTKGLLVYSAPTVTWNPWLKPKTVSAKCPVALTNALPWKATPHLDWFRLTCLPAEFGDRCFCQSRDRKERKVCLTWLICAEWRWQSSRCLWSDSPPGWQTDLVTHRNPEAHLQDLIWHEPKLSCCPPGGVPTLNEQMPSPLTYPLSLFLSLQSFCYICFRVMDDWKGWLQFTPGELDTIRNHFLPISLIAAISYRSDLLSFSGLCASLPMMDLPLILRCRRSLKEQCSSQQDVPGGSHLFINCWWRGTFKASITVMYLEC